MAEVTISVNDETIQLTGKEAEEFEKARAKEHSEFLKSQTAFQAVQESKAQAKESAKAKLAALGLSDDEITGILGS